MPFGDQTGPMGQGPMTGRGRGYCTGNAAPGRFNAGPGLGMGRGGRGWRNGLRALGAATAKTPSTATSAAGEQEVAELKTALGSMLATLNQIQKRLDGMEAAQKTT